MTAVGSYPMGSDAAELAGMLLWAAGIRYSTVADDAYPSDSRRRVLFVVGDADANDAVAVLTDRLRTTRRENDSADTADLARHGIDALEALGR